MRSLSRPAPFGPLVRLALLMAGLTALVGAAGYWLAGSAGLAVAIGLSALVNLALYFWSHRMVLRMYGARVVGPEEAPALHAAVDALRRRAGLPMPTIAIAPQEQPNAFATGRGHRHAVVCVTRGLLDRLTPDEVEGVLAHELAHIRNRDMLVMTVTASLAGAVSHLANIVALGSLFGDPDEDGGHPLAELLLILVAPIAAMLVQLAISRQREYAADAYAAWLTGRPLSLANALAKIDSIAHREPMAVNPAAAPLAQVNPLSAASGRLAHWFMTHPPTDDRIRRLNAMRTGFSILPQRRTA